MKKTENGIILEYIHILAFTIFILIYNISRAKVKPFFYDENRIDARERETGQVLFRKRNVEYILLHIAARELW